MVGMTRWLRIGVATLAMASVCRSAWATCTAGEMTPQEEQMACCEAGHHDCGPSGEAADCCKKSASQHAQQLVATKLGSFKAPLRILLLTLTPPQPATLQVSAIPAYCLLSPAGQSSASGPPRYIAFSSLLI